jgi:hypothetical protein
MKSNFRRLLGTSILTAANLSLASCVAIPAAPLPALAKSGIVVPDVADAAPARALAAPRELQPIVAKALAALQAHAGQVPHHDRIGVVDFSLPSSEPRFFLVDTATGKIERSWLVAHGSGSDPKASGMAQRFSNRPGSNASSRGAYVTASTYVGKHGLSQRLIGLDPDNNEALQRAIVIHGAPYVSPSLIAAQGRIGRSQGEGRLIYADTET